MKSFEAIILSLIHLETYQVQIVNTWETSIKNLLGVVEVGKTKVVTNNDNIVTALELAQAVCMCVADGLRSEPEVMAKAKEIVILDTEFGYDIYTKDKDLIAIVEVTTIKQ